MIKEWEDEKRNITVEEALHLIKEGEYIHTFRNPAPGILLGADISRERLAQLFEEHKDSLELTGIGSRAMKHGIGFTDEMGQLFIETDQERLNAFDPMPEK